VSGTFTVDDAGQLICNIDTLVDTRMLVQANSGGGKSWALRRILERTHGRVQHLVLDPEGEFSSLREEHDYVLAAPHGGDTVAQPRSAALLAERLLELGVSAVLDLYELKAHERVRFVQLFLEALINAPKKLWHPVLVVVDEAHVYCPQSGSAESAGAVIDLCSRGRKRGYSALLATQRIQKLHKDAAAELNNKLIGRTTLDVDLARAADELGFAKTRWNELKELAPGHFFASGPAFNKRGVIPVKIGPVFTTHPKAGSRIAFAPVPPTSAIRALLPKLADLPAEAEQRTKTLDELQAEVKRLRRELDAKPVSEQKIVEVSVLLDVDREMIQRAAAAIGEATAALATTTRSVQARVSAAHPPTPARMIHTPSRAQDRIARAEQFPTKTSKEPVQRGQWTSSLGAGERAVLTAIAQHTDGVDREQVTVLTGYKRSTRDAYIARLRVAGLVNDGPLITVTPDGLDSLGSDFEPLPTGEALREHWLGRLPDGERKLFELVIEAYPESAERDALGDDSGYKRSTRDAYLSRLATRKLIVAGRGSVRASDTLFAAL
jgi:hypothetical protein